MRPFASLSIYKHNTLKLKYILPGEVQGQGQSQFQGYVSAVVECTVYCIRDIICTLSEVEGSPEYRIFSLVMCQKFSGGHYYLQI